MNRLYAIGEPPLIPRKTEDLFSAWGEEGIWVHQPDQVANYVSFRPGLLQMLPPICQIVRNRFPRPIPIRLVLYKDIEIEDQYLTFSIRPKQVNVEFWQGIQSASEACWRLLENSSDWLLITADVDEPEPLKRHVSRGGVRL